MWVLNKYSLSSSITEGAGWKLLNGAVLAAGKINPGLRHHSAAAVGPIIQNGKLGEPLALPRKPIGAQEP